MHLRLLLGVGVIASACAPAIEPIELPILPKTGAVILSAGERVFAFDASSPEASTEVESLPSTSDEGLEIALYRCSLEELGLVAGLQSPRPSGQSLPATRCAFERSPSASDGGASWSFAAELPASLAALRIDRGVERCFPAWMEPGCEVTPEGYEWSAPSSSLAPIGTGRGGFIEPESTAPWVQFGTRLAIDGDTLVVGWPTNEACPAGVGAEEHDRGCDASGAALIYRWSPDGWQKEAYLKPSHVHEGQLFGSSVAISGDRVIVGAYRDAGCGAGVNAPIATLTCQSVGAAFVFLRTKDGWKQEALLKPGSPTNSDWFGAGVAISDDLAAVSAVGEDSCVAGASKLEGQDGCTNSGAVYLFRRRAGTWQPEWLLKSDQPEALAQLGVAISLSNGVLVASTNSVRACTRTAYEEIIPSVCLRSGLAEVFRRSPDDVWRWDAALPVPDRDSGLPYSAPVAIDGPRIFLGNPTAAICSSPSESCPRAGGVAVYRTDRPGYPLETLLEPTETATDGDYFGGSLSASRGVLLVGASGTDACAPMDDALACVDAGAAFAYRSSERGLQLEARLLPSRVGYRGSGFGERVAISEGFAAIGAPDDSVCEGRPLDDPCHHRGVVYTYDPPLP